MNGLGWCFDQRHDAERALAWYDRCLETAPNFLTARLNRATLLAQTGRQDAAEKDARSAVEQSPTSVQAVFLLAELCANAGRRDEAAAHYRRALELDPSFEAARNGLDSVLGAAVQSPGTVN
jgi:tetratricopeptide (TPR) repeat protein